MSTFIQHRFSATGQFLAILQAKIAHSKTASNTSDEAKMKIRRYAVTIFVASVLGPLCGTESGFAQDEDSRKKLSRLSAQIDAARQDPTQHVVAISESTRYRSTPSSITADYENGGHLELKYHAFKDGSSDLSVNMLFRNENRDISRRNLRILRSKELIYVAVDFADGTIKSGTNASMAPRDRTIINILRADGKEPILRRRDDKFSDEENRFTVGTPQSLQTEKIDSNHWNRYFEFSGKIAAATDKHLSTDKLLSELEIASKIFKQIDEYADLFGDDPVAGGGWPKSAAANEGTLVGEASIGKSPENEKRLKNQAVPEIKIAAEVITDSEGVKHATISPERFVVKAGQKYRLTFANAVQPQAFKFFILNKGTNFGDFVQMLALHTANPEKRGKPLDDERILGQTIVLDSGKKHSLDLALPRDVVPGDYPIFCAVAGLAAAPHMESTMRVTGADSSNRSAAGSASLATAAQTRIKEIHKSADDIEWIEFEYTKEEIPANHRDFHQGSVSLSVPTGVEWPYTFRILTTFKQEGPFNKEGPINLKLETYDVTVAFDQSRILQFQKLDTLYRMYSPVHSESNVRCQNLYLNGGRGVHFESARRIPDPKVLKLKGGLRTIVDEMRASEMEAIPTTDINQAAVKNAAEEYRRLADLLANSDDPENDPRLKAHLAEIFVN